MKPPIERIEELRSRVKQHRRPAKVVSIGSDFHRDLQPGWLLPYLLELDRMMWCRWEWWVECLQRWDLLPGPIPQIEWLDQPDRDAYKHMEETLNCIPRHGSWQSMGGWDYFRYFLQWFLYGCCDASVPELPAEPAGCEGASMRLYRRFNAGIPMLYPYDYFGDMLAENAYGKKQGFFPTPMPLVRLMWALQHSGGGEAGQDPRTRSVCDPAVGTGRMLLVASNDVLPLYGQDIDQTMVWATRVNMFLYAPWGACPAPWLKP